MSDELPQGWTTAELQDVCSKVQDGTHFSPKNQTRNGDFKYITAKNIKVRGIDLSDVTYVNKEIHREIYERCNPEKGDVLYIKDGATTGIATVNDLEEEFSLLSSVALLKPRKEALSAHYLKWYLNSPAGFEAMTDQMTGSAITRLVLRTIRKSRIPLAPLAEQRRIVVKLENLLGKVDACQQRLAKIPVLLKRFRQSVLGAASSGHLTADWREKNPLVSISSERDGDADLPEIPPSWRWVKLPKTGEMNRGRSRHRPRDEPSLYGGPYPFIQTGDIAQSGGRIARHKQSYSELGLAQSRQWPAGTICITIAANIAESAILTYPACFPDSVVGIIVNPDMAVAEYVEFFIRVAKRDLAAFAPATAQKNINIAILGEVQVPLPPLAEQQEIVHRVEALFALADQIEARYAKAKAHVEKLSQSVLAKAFRGELVPQDPNDEPASVLLERIKNARSDSSQEGKNRRSNRSIACAAP